MRTVAIIQARLGSTRFPRKVLEDICGRPMIAHVVERARAMVTVADVFVACPESDVETIAAALRGVDVFGAADENDVLGRFNDVAKDVAADVVVRVTADCPLCAPDIADHVVSLFREPGRCDYATNALSEHYVDGLDVEVFTASLLDSADRLVTSPYDREHCTPWLRRHGIVRVWPSGRDNAHPKISVDTAEDLERVRRIMTHVKGLNFADTLAAAVEAGL